jgi:hypothetical protein
VVVETTVVEMVEDVMDEDKRYMLKGYQIIEI